MSASNRVAYLASDREEAKREGLTLFTIDVSPPGSGRVTVQGSTLDPNEVEELWAVIRRIANRRKTLEDTT